jgi:hypothetical protein
VQVKYTSQEGKIFIDSVLGFCGFYFLLHFKEKIKLEESFAIAQGSTQRKISFNFEC